VKLILIAYLTQFVILTWTQYKDIINEILCIVFIWSLQADKFYLNHLTYMDFIKFVVEKIVSQTQVIINILKSFSMTKFFNEYSLFSFKFKLIDIN
jgi:hypothetical protein